jgi:hypothetical protein
MKPTDQIKLTFTDFPGPFNPTAILNLLSRHFPVVLDENLPDYVIHSVFGSRFLDYPDAVRIFFTGENVHPDFNLCDYAFGFDWMQLEDRYCRCPNYLFYDEFLEIVNRRRTLNPSLELKAKKRFCNFIYSNGQADPFRTDLFNRLCQYQRVDSAGPYLNNTGFCPGNSLPKWKITHEKVLFQRECKFSIAAENSSTIGYTTEKLVHALAADTIPIYWGNPAAAREFNAKRFISCHDFDSLDAMVERVREIDQSEALGLEILSEPFFPDNVVPESLKEETIVSQFQHIFSQGRLAQRRNRHVWGKIYEERRKEEVRAANLIRRSK